MTHQLKTDPDAFHLLWNGKKRFECRLADRPFASGDVLCLQEFLPDGRYTGREVLIAVLSVWPGGKYGIEPTHVVMSFGPPNRRQS